MIITDTDSLRQISIPVELTDPQTLGKEYCSTDLISRKTESIIKRLLELFPKQALGLAAPQIGIFERIFTARLSSGHYIFINPKLKLSDAVFASVEACLSLPGIQKCVSRSTKASIEADLIYQVKEELVVIPAMNELQGLDAAIVQHEYDHLEGTLLIDYADAPTEQQKMMEVYRNRRERVVSKRSIRKAKSQNESEPVKMSPQRLKKREKMQKLADKKRKKRVEIQEFQKALEEGIIEPSTT